MNSLEYQHWWQLHLRIAKGESLAPQEREVYQTGLDLLDREEATQLNAVALNTLRILRSQVQRLNQIHANLSLQSLQLSEKIDVLELAYKQLTGYELAVDAHATSSF